MRGSNAAISVSGSLRGSRVRAVLWDLRDQWMHGQTRAGSVR
jgi:hypothetical protein